MNVTRQARLEPGSKEAHAKGCICEKPKDGQYFIDEHCPLHWYMVLVARVSDIHVISSRRDTQYTVLITALLISVGITFIYFLLH